MMEESHTVEGRKHQKPKMHDLSLSFEEVAVLGPSFFIAVFVSIVGAFIAVHGVQPMAKFNIAMLAIGFIPAGLIGIVLHEFIHGICFAYLSGYNFSIVRFGFDKKTFTPYAHCKLPIKAWAYKVALLMPGILVGVVPTVYAIIVGSVPWLVFGFFFTLGAVGDAIIFALIYHVNNGELVEDHPQRAGCYVQGSTKPDISLAMRWLAFSKRYHRVMRFMMLLVMLTFFALLGFQATKAIIAWL